MTNNERKDERKDSEERDEEMSSQSTRDIGEQDGRNQSDTE